MPHGDSPRAHSNWPSLPLPDVQKELRTDFLIGLAETEAKKRLVITHPNSIPEGKAESLFLIFLRQFQSPLIYVLLIASALVLVIGDTTDSLIILFILIFNATVGTIQEGKAKNTLAALKKFVKTSATVLRDEKENIIPDTEVIVGDIIILQEGEKIPADARILESRGLEVNEAALTGESLPVLKTEKTLEGKELPVIKQKNMVFKGTSIVRGHGKAAVVATGIDTLIGKISERVSSLDTEIPLKTNIRYLSRLILVTVVLASAIIFSIGTGFNHLPAKEMFKTAVAIIVSIIPEGLPVVITLVLATGVWRMARKNALVKKLQAVEALGQARVIALDKTGTITKNEMIVREVFIGNRIFEIGGYGYEPKGEVKLNGETALPANHSELILAGKIAALCANARVAFIENEKVWKTSGDPTEAALLVFGEKIGFYKDALDREMPPMDEIPFNYKDKIHATTHRSGKTALITVAGSPEETITLCKNIYLEGKSVPLTEGKIDGIHKRLHRMSEEGLRVIAFAFKEEAPKDENLALKDLNHLTFGGFYGIEDSIRPEVEEAVAKAREAGIKVVMVTGDYKVTAIAIAKEAGLWQRGDEITTGEELRNLPEKELDQKIKNITVFAQVTPEDKMRIIESYRRRGEIIAMTGDGVNDAPSLVAADLGVAMGKIGTEVAKEAADIVLLDDNFGTIVSAIEEGRSIYKTTKKVILYLFSTSLGELLTIAGALILKFPLPVLAAQILWLNLVTDGFLDVALAMEPKESGLLKKTFERSKKYLIDKLAVERMVVMAIPMMLGTLYLFSQNYQTDLAHALTISLTTLAVFQWLNAWNCRSEDGSLFKTNPFSNKFLIGATLIVITLQLFAVYNPLMQKILRTTPLSGSEWVVIITISLSVILVEETRKFFRRRLQASSLHRRISS